MKDQVEYSQDGKRLAASPHCRPGAPQRQDGERRPKPGVVAGQGAVGDPVVNDLMIRRILAALASVE